MSQSGVFLFDGTRIGTVVRFAGGPTETRWQAYASNDRQQGFRLKKDAIAWLKELAREERPK